MRWLWLTLLTLVTAQADEPAVCGERCQARGLELVVVEQRVPVSGFTVEQVSAEYNAALLEIRYATPHLGGWEPCFKCGSAEILDGASLRYELTVPLPAWDEPASLSEADRQATRRWIAAIQGHVYRHVAAHREALEAVPVKNRAADEVLAGAKGACLKALEAGEALDQAGGCITGTTLGGVTAAPIRSCQPRHKAPRAELCDLGS